MCHNRYKIFNLLFPVLNVGGSSPFGRARAKTAEILVLQGFQRFSFIIFSMLF